MQRSNGKVTQLGYSIFLALFLLACGSFISAMAKSETEPGGYCYPISGFPLLGKCYQNTEGGYSCIIAITPMDCTSSGKD